MMISDIVKYGLCCGCGACVGVCPAGALSLNDITVHYAPVFSPLKCTGCGLCRKVCPGKGWPATQYAEDLCRKENIDNDLKYGPLRGCYLGQSTDPLIVHSAASGGTATGLLLFLLDTGLIDAAIVVILQDGIPRPVVTSDRNEILQASGSKYVPVPIMHTVLKEILTHPEKTIAVTMLPCHAAALENLIRINPGIHRERIYIVGLFCGNVNEYKHLAQIERTLNKKGNGLLRNEPPVFLGWRYGAWPGCAAFAYRDSSGKQIVIEKDLQRWLGIARTYYALSRCLMCPSRENWLADVALADNHRGKTNETVVLARTKNGESLLSSAASGGYIHLNPAAKDKIVSLTKFVPAIYWIASKHKKRKPVYDYDEAFYLDTESELNKYIASLKNRLYKIARNKFIFAALKLIPSFMENIGFHINTINRSQRVKKLLKRMIANKRRNIR
jgi:coenzyme F420 hydrogenase subunit beta